MKKFLTIIGLLSATTLFATLAAAQTQSDQKHRRRHAPPPQAFEACQQKAEGDACSFQGRRKEREGTCKTFQKNNELVCAPKHFHRRKFKKEALKACTDKKEGAVCTFQGRKGTRDGTCKLWPKMNSLICAPERSKMHRKN